MAQSVDQGSGTINLTIGQERTSYNTLDDFTSNVITPVSKVPNYKVISSEKTTLSGLPAHKIIYIITVQEQDIELMQVWTLKENTSHTFTYRISPENYDTYINIANQVLNSIQIN